jgi:hypothetical protein
MKKPTINNSSALSYLSNVKERLKYSLLVSETFRKRFIGSRVRFGRTKTKRKFYAKITRISWTHSQKKGGGFIVWLTYRGLAKRKMILSEVVERTNREVLREMLNDYSIHIDNLISKNTKKIKPIKKDTYVNTSKDLQICIEGTWATMETVFPISVRELKTREICLEWTRK